MTTAEEWPTPDRWRLEHALRLWRAAETVIRHSPSTAERRTDYELAIDTALRHLQSRETLEALLAHYYGDRHRPRLVGSGAPEPGTVEAWVVAARDSVPRGQELNPTLIEDAAFWRRLRQLVSRAAI